MRSTKPNGGWKYIVDSHGHKEDMRRRRKEVTFKLSTENRDLSIVIVEGNLRPDCTARQDRQSSVMFC